MWKSVFIVICQYVVSIWPWDGISPTFLHFAMFGMFSYRRSPTKEPVAVCLGAWIDPVAMFAMHVLIKTGPCVTHHTTLCALVVGSCPTSGSNGSSFPGKCHKVMHEVIFIFMGPPRKGDPLCFWVVVRPSVRPHFLPYRQGWTD